MSSVEKTEIESEVAPAMQPRRKRGVPEGLWIGCEGCKQTVYRQRVEENGECCPECGHHFYISAQKRIRLLLDTDSFEEWFANLSPKDPLGFVDKRPYAERLKEEQARTGMREACIVGRGYLRGRPLVFGVTDSAFIMGSMGSVVGEKLTRAIEAATELHLPLVIVSASGGGARMHEGIISLMQMGKVSGALARYHQGGGLFISVLTNPTMGGVAASFASLGDVVLAEPRGADRFCRTTRGRFHSENLVAERLSDERIPVGARLCRSHRGAEGFGHRDRAFDRLLRDVSRHEFSPVVLSAAAMSPTGPTFRQRFDLIGRLGNGSMSKVWRALDKSVGRVVALKILDMEKTLRYESRFSDRVKPTEGEIACQLVHPNIVHTMEHGRTTRDEQYLVMELIDGIGLAYLVDCKTR